jgi:hypothetical protein
VASLTTTAASDNGNSIITSAHVEGQLGFSSTIIETAKTETGSPPRLGIVK